MGALYRHAAILTALVALCPAVGACGSQPAPVRTTIAPAAATPVRVRVTLEPRRVLAHIPRSFLGISTEYWTIPFWSAHPQLLARVFSQLEGSGGPIYLRIGGDSADRSFWSPRRELPEWVFELTHDWLGRTATVIRATGARVILDLNVVTATPSKAAGWARTARARLRAGAASPSRSATSQISTDSASGAT